MYSGPGSGPILAAASAWDQLAHELRSSAAACRSVIAGLTTAGWQGSSSLMMADAVAPYVTWLHGTAAEAEQTAVQAKNAAGAYQTAYAMTVPPSQIAANRTQLHSLLASNFFGQNSPAIAATEANYEQMWAQDVAAMYGYAVSSSTASRLTPFTDPPRTTDPAGPVTQTAAASGSGGSPAQATTTQLLAQLPTTMQQLAAPTAAMDPPSLLSYLLKIPNFLSAAASGASSSFSGAAITTTNHALAVNAMRDEAQGIGPFDVGFRATAASAGPVSVGTAPASAAIGRASLVSTLSVPQSWSATVTPPVSSAAAPAPGGSAAVAPATVATIPGGGMFGEALLGALAGRGVSNAAAKLRRPSVIPRSPAAG
jgi:PPE-repeat protein